MRVAVIQDWVQLERIEAPEKRPWSPLLFTEAERNGMEDRPVCRLIAAGPECPPEIQGAKPGALTIAYDENYARTVAGLNMENYVFVRWKHCIGPVTDDPWPAVDEARRIEQRKQKADEERKKQESELIASAARRGAARLVTAAGAAPRAPRPALVEP